MAFDLEKGVRGAIEKQHFQSIFFLHNSHMNNFSNLIIICFLSAAKAFHRVKRQSDDNKKTSPEDFEKELCKDKDAGEWFRLIAGDGDNCRDVIQCTSSVSFELSLFLFFFAYFELVFTFCEISNKKFIF